MCGKIGSCRTEALQVFYLEVGRLPVSIIQELGFFLFFYFYFYFIFFLGTRVLTSVWS